MRRRIAMLTVGGLLAAAALIPLLAGGPEAAASIDPANFSSPKANPYFPLRPGTTFVYRGHESGDHLLERMTVTSKTKTIVGVQTVVVRDVMWANGVLDEKTTDWYQADDNGTVWYFGEATATYKPNGKVESREGSWQAGRDGAVAGVIMPANPHPTDAYRQEFRKGHAEDQAWIVQNHLAIRVPIGRVDDVVRSFEWTRLEPHVVSVKFYAPHLGIVREQDVAGGTEFMELVAVHRR
jgi:hypothetical protein